LCDVHFLADHLRWPCLENPTVYRSTLLPLCLLAFIPAGTVHGEISPPTGADWQTHCKGYLRALEGDPKADDFDVTYCIGATQGMLNGLRIGSQLGALSLGSTLAVTFDLDPQQVFAVFESRAPEDLLQICSPADATVADYVRTIDAYLDEHPDKGTNPLAEVFFEALQAKWPCDDSD
jgi:hypothetical protein